MDTSNLPALRSDASDVQRRRRRDQLGLSWDLLIITLVIANLTLILFDSLFAAGPVAALVAWISQDFHDWYAAVIRPNFLTIDLVFVAIFLSDVLLGWAIAIRQRTYERWFYYPLAHWYDVLGCIPLAGFRWLRVLRVISLGFRLQRLGFIDVRTWPLYATGRRYYDILVEEVSDRVVVNVLNGVQEELRSGASDLPRRVVQEVVRPRHDPLVAALADTLGGIVRSAYADYREDWRAYIRDVVRHTIERNAAGRGLERVPIVGDAVLRALDSILTEVVSDVLDAAVQGLGDAEYRSLVSHIAEGVFTFMEREPDNARDPELQQALVEIIELVKQQVQVQRWRESASA